jgi:hypothetical protein
MPVIGGRYPPPVRGRTTDSTASPRSPQRLPNCRAIQKVVTALVRRATAPYVAKVGSTVIAGRHEGSHSVPPIVLMNTDCGAWAPCWTSWNPCAAPKTTAKSPSTVATIGRHRLIVARILSFSSKRNSAPRSLWVSVWRRRWVGRRLKYRAEWPWLKRVVVLPPFRSTNPGWEGVNSADPRHRSRRTSRRALRCRSYSPSAD